jgi:hypothetical protein
MSRSRRGLGIVGLTLSLTACFHQTVHSGLTPSTTVIERPYVATWLWGIVPADTIDTRQSCPSGVATVETQQSFMNGFVSFFTLGIYAPQRVRITCAS